MEIKTTPTKLKLLLEAGILPKIKPLFDPLILTPKKDVLVNQQNHGNILALYHTYAVVLAYVVLTLPLSERGGVDVGVVAVATEGVDCDHFVLSGGTWVGSSFVCLLCLAYERLKQLGKILFG